MSVGGSSIATLVIFILSVGFVIQPISISIPRPYGRTKRVVKVPLNLTTAPIIAIIVLWAAQYMGPTQIRNGIVGTDGVKPYNILILFFSLAYMAITLDMTGILEAAAFWVRNKGGTNGYKLFLYFYLMVTVLSILLGNDPVILSGTAFLVYYTKVTELQPISWLISEFVAANTASMVLFVGNPTNVVICEGFAINNAAFTAYTILPFVGCSLAGLLALAFQFRRPEHIPRRIPIAQPLDVRLALRDPTGALIGSFLLGSCLIVSVIVSFFHIDVWKITLPFAFAKFVFDILWDYHRHVKGIQNPLLVKIVDETRSESSELAGGSLHPETTLPVSGTSSHRRNSEDSLISKTSLAEKVRSQFNLHFVQFANRFPTLSIALPRLPFALVPFAFSQFILIEALAHQGWIDIFASWLVLATHRGMYHVVWVVGFLGVILCNVSGTNIGATILLTKVCRAAVLSPSTNRAAAIALAVASNIGAVSFTFSASLAGLLWNGILKQKGINVGQATFARWNFLPVVAMTGVGLGIVCAEMKVLSLP